MVKMVSKMEKVLRIFIASQRYLSTMFDAFLPNRYRIDGNTDFLRQVVPRYLSSGLRVADIGSGRTPYFSLEQKQDLSLNVTGFDISSEEIGEAPVGSYDDVHIVDIATYRGQHEFDMVICQSLLEHIENVEPVFEAMSTLLKNGAVALLFVPSKNAIYSRLNVLLPQELKKRILYFVYPDTRHTQGFPAFYHRCTPRDFRNMSRHYGFAVEECIPYFKSSYFSFFFPLYFIWRLWILGFSLIAGEQAAETFTMVLRYDGKD